MSQKKDNFGKMKITVTLNGIRKFNNDIKNIDRHFVSVNTSF